MTYALERQARKHKITRQILEANGMKVLRKIVAKTKVDGIRSQKIKQPTGIQPVNKWVKIRRRE